MQLKLTLSLQLIITTLYTGAVQPNEVAAPSFWNAALIVSPEPHIPREKSRSQYGIWGKRIFSGRGWLKKLTEARSDYSGKE